MSRVCGLLFCFNEEDILGETLPFYLSQGIDLVVFDNESTDSSREIVESFRREPSSYPGRILELLTVASTGYEWQKILRFACGFMHERLSDSEWILLIDADGFYRSPVRGLSLVEFLDEVGREGYEVVNGALYTFYPTEADDPGVEGHRDRLRFCRPYPHWPPVQQRIFRYRADLDFYTDCGHQLYPDGLRECPIQFIYEHYVWLSFEHGTKKVFEDRRPRYTDLPGGQRYFAHHLHLVPIEGDFVLRSRDLWRYRLRQLQISRLGFRSRMALKPLLEHWFAWRRRAGFRVKIIRDRLGYRFRIARSRPRRSLGTLARRMLRLGRSLPAVAPVPTPLSQFRPVTERLIDAQPTVLHHVPTRYHFLMTDFCNVRCNFCNQDFDPSTRSQVSLGSFRRMVSHIPRIPGCSFSFSGGGDPLLCADLVDIIRHVDETRPETRTAVTTNGFLLKRFAADLAGTGLDELWLAVHGATTASNNRLLQTRAKEDVFAALPVLEEELAQAGNTSMRKVFYMVVSQANIDELPELVARAPDFGVGRVHAALCRYYPWETYRFDGGTRPGHEESLFYDQDRYNRVVAEARAIADSEGVEFGHDALFGKGAKSRPCRQPWERVLVDVDGTAYPCLGGEVWFRNRVRSGELSFGNLLNEHVLSVVNSEGYVRARRTCSAFSNETVLPECRDCHQSLDLQGPDVEHAHVLRMPRLEPRSF